MFIFVFELVSMSVLVLELHVVLGRLNLNLVGSTASPDFAIGKRLTIVFAFMFRIGNGLSEIMATAVAKGTDATFTGGLVCVSPALKF